MSDRAVEARGKAVAIYRESVTLEQWAGLKQALGTQSKARQKCYDALDSIAEPKFKHVPLLTLHRGAVLIALAQRVLTSDIGISS
jgi:hypothetical protein